MKLRVPLLPRSVRWAAVLAVAAFIFYASILGSPPETALDDLTFSLIPLDKWRHFLAYAAFGGALAYATTNWNVERRVLAGGVFATVVLYGIGIEVGQSQIPERYFSLGDAYANALGGVLVLPYYLLQPYLSFTPLRSWLQSVAGSS
ncbi:MULTISPECIES: VanZ family protein [Salinibaculum]|uniref:VanZ family protein n=1 Tax=Salinibaculum TaxID=2732368 RepID=UPI0030D57182